MKSRIYVETSVISYLAARPTANAVNAARQYFSYQLWQRREELGLVVSNAVIDEASDGDAQAAAARLNYCSSLQVLQVPDEAITLARELVLRKVMPGKAYADAVHIAVAALHRVQFIASWNFRHIAGPLAKRNIELALTQLGYNPPMIATPEDLLESIR